MVLKLGKALIASIFVVVSTTMVRADYDTQARAAILYDVTTGLTLMEKEADMPLPPASMSKLMTLYMLFEALRDGRVTLDTEFSVSTKARQIGGSTMFLDETDRPTVEDLIKGIIVVSGNDACIVVAEGLAGSEDAFARLMNERATAIGLTNSTFVNSTGWPAANHRMSVRDLATLAGLIITEFPEYYSYFALEEFDYDGRSPANRFNRNPILGMGIGADGLKTGHTQEAGYGLVGSALQGNRRVIFVVAGLESVASRSQESQAMVNWAFRQFVERDVAAEGDRIADAPVWMGDTTSVGLVAPRDISLLFPAVMGEDPAFHVEYDGPLEPPIAEGEEIAELVIEIDGMPPARLPLVADRAVAEGGFVPRARAAAQILLTRAIGEAQALTE
ncbi:MAG: D-alanyl-D-alanine carboxypeptidase [Rhodobacteraceae bacterium]|nr:D-alanyl-D-alanine carboxypeptidase [Paracoccaceae bacterium]